MTAPGYQTLSSCSCGGADLAATAVRFHLGARPFRLVRCRKCGRMLLDPPPSEVELAASYDPLYYGEGESKFIGPVEAFVEHFRGMRARQAHRMLSATSNASSAPGARQHSGTPPRRRQVLDIGCGSGQFLGRLATFGYECHGTELSEETGRRAAAVPGVQLHVGPIDRDTYPPESFDLISIWHVLEHLSDPDEVIRNCRRWLAPGGHLMIAVPNVASWQAGLFRGSWFHLDPPRHLQHFDPVSLGGILRDAGFRTLQVRHLSWEQNLYGYIQSALNALGFPRDQLYGLFKGNRPSRKPVSLTVQAVLATVLLPAAVVMTALEAAFRRGGTIECTAALIPARRGA